MSTVEMSSSHSTELMGNIELGIEMALKDIFATMFSEEAKVIPHVEISDSPRISSVVGFTGRLSGMLSLHFRSDMACKMASALLGMPVTQADENVRDAVGELSNMLAGGLKKKLSDTDNMFKISIPTVIVGSQYSMHAPANAHQMWIGVETQSCRFAVQLVLEQE